MGLDIASNSQPSRPRFYLDVKSPLGTEGKQNREKNKNVVLDRKEFLESFLETSSNMVSVAVQGIVLKSKLYCEAAGLCSALSNEQLIYDNGVELIIDTVCQRDFLSVISKAYKRFHRVLNTRRNNNVSLKFFEVRFSASVAKFNSMSGITKLPQCITALMLSSNAAIEHSQHVQCLNAAAPEGTIFSDQSSNDKILSAVTYQQLASVVKQCEKAPSTPISLPMIL